MQVKSPKVDDDHNEPVESAGLLEILALLRVRWKLLTLAPVLAGAVAYGLAFLIPPTYTAQTTFLPPQQRQSAATAALSSLGALTGLAPGAGFKSPVDQYVSLMQSVTVSDRIIDKFDLIQVFDAKFRVDARKKLATMVNMSIGKRDGLLTVSVDDSDADRAARIANAYVDELRTISSSLAITEAQQRRVFFEQQMQQTKDKLTSAQRALEASGFGEGALRSEPRSAAETYARLQAEVTAAEVRIQTMRGAYNESAPEFRAAQDRLSALRTQLAKTAQARGSNDESDYVGRFREFKYQEALFELFSRQYELARLDESREGALIQIVDPAMPPERRSKPTRSLIAVLAAAVTWLFCATRIVLSYAGGLWPISPARAARLQALRAAVK